MCIVYECHPLEPIFRQDKKALLDMVNRDPSAPNLSAMGASGYTALKHLVIWPEGLDIILKRFGKSILQKHDVDYTSAFEEALIFSGEICTSSQTLECFETCSCTTSLKLLLETDSDSFRRAVAQPNSQWIRALIPGSWRARHLVIEYLKCERHQLKQLGLSCMKLTDIDRLSLSQPQVIDRYLHEVLKALKTAGVTIETQFMTESIDIDDRFKSFSMYHQIARLYYYDGLPLAETLYSKGFYDIDLPDDSGFTPLASSKNTRVSTWLIAHGASLENQLPNHTLGITVAHKLFSDVGFGGRDVLNLRQENARVHLLKFVRSLATSDSYSDGCYCGCSSDGCHPYTTMWKELIYWSSKDFVTSTSLKEKVNKIYDTCVLLEDGWEVPRNIKSICLRACTFAALPIRHTCCSRWYSYEDERETRVDFFSEKEETEIREIREEDMVELVRLEDLILEFERILDETNSSLAVFFQTYWATRMSQVLQEMQEQVLTEEDIARARNLGIVLVEDNMKEEEELKEDQSQVSYWYQKLDDILVSSS